jgi:hypothetical protein
VGGILALLVSLAWCGWASQYKAFTTGGKITWGISLAAVVVVAGLLFAGRRGWRLGIPVRAPQAPWPRPGRGGAGPAFAGTWPWLALTLCILAWEILGLDTGPHQPHLTISALVLFARPLRAATLWTWMAVGCGFAWARARAAGLREEPGAPELGAARPPVENRASRGRAPQVPGASAMVVGLLLPHVRAAGYAFWGCVVAAGVGLHLLGRRSGGRRADFEELLRFISRPAWARVLLIIAWTYAGWHLFAH